MKNLFILTFTIILSSCSSTKKITAVKDAAGNLVGIANKNSFKQEPYGSEWFNDYYSYYTPEDKTINELKPLLKGVTIKAFMGTWCGDSKREIPNFYKILDQTAFNYKNLTMVTVNRAKEANGLEKGHDIQRVPTFIFYKKGKEIGRFVEHTVDGATLEHDILQIVAEKPYKHAYEK